MSIPAGPPPGLAAVRLVPLLALLLARDGHAGPADVGSGTRLVHLFFADGQTPLPGDQHCNGARVPSRHRCAPEPAGAPGLEAAACRADIVRQLDDWYAAFDVAFTDSAPSGPHDTIVITSDPGWCRQPPEIAGDAPQVCAPLADGTAYVYRCGPSVAECAALIAHEHGHLMGLEHVSSPHDLMAEGACLACDGFQDRDNPVVTPSVCTRARQNGHRLLLQHLGPRVPVSAAGCAIAASAGQPAIAPAPPLVVAVVLLAFALARRRSARLADPHRASGLQHAVGPRPADPQRGAGRGQIALAAIQRRLQRAHLLGAVPLALAEPGPRGRGR
jgi:hypothetical protein